MHDDSNGGNDGDGERITSDAALAFWGERADSPGDLAWKAWRRSLEELSAFLANCRAESAADEARLVEMKAAADRQAVEAEAESARLQAEIERLEMDAGVRAWRAKGNYLQ